MSENLRPFHHGHKLVGALIWATSRWFAQRPDAWEGHALPGVSKGGVMVRGFSAMLAEDLWMMMQVCKACIEEGAEAHIKMFRYSRRISRLFHYWKTAEICIAPLVDSRVGSTNWVQPGASQITEDVFRELLDEVDAWGGTDKVLEMAEYVVRRYVEYPEIDDVMFRIVTTQPGTKVWGRRSGGRRGQDPCPEGY